MLILGRFEIKDFEEVQAEKLSVGDLIFGSGDDSQVERMQDWLGVDHGLGLKFYRVIKVNQSSFWVMDFITKTKFKLAKWFWDGSGPMKVRRVPKQFMQEVESELVDSSLQYRLFHKKTKPVAKVLITCRF
jgi:hypothetical protein